jgi:hypothetical protein
MLESMHGTEIVQIQLFYDSNLLTENSGSIFTVVDFGGVIPQPGDLIAVPREQGSDRDHANSPRMHVVVERYFWPRDDPALPVRVSLLLRERRAHRASSRRKPAAPRVASTPPAVSQDIPFIIQQIYLCLRLARETHDTEIAVALRQLAKIFVQQAVDRGADPDTLPKIEETA